MKLYLASYLGFSAEYYTYRQKIKIHLLSIKTDILDPWDNTEFEENLQNIHKISDYESRIEQYKIVAAKIGLLNERLIRSSDIVLGVLDGLEVDSGVASEIGFAAGLGKRCYGLRTDFRNSGELDGIPINLQVLHFIKYSGGRLFRDIAEIAF